MDKVLLKICNVNFGYKKFGVQFDFANPGASEPCHINANCRAGDNWNNEKNSVAMIVVNGVIQCTGSLIMNTCNTNTPYFLTANHCLEAGNVPNWVFQFQTLSTDCETNVGWREDIQFNGCVLRANNGASDFALLQLNTTPAANSGLFYSGWSRQTNGNTSTTILHHPAGDLMKISVDNQPPVAMNSLGVDVWQIDQDLGRLQGGSSGAPYYNQNHQIIGQHWRRPEAGTRPICDITVAQGGRFDRSWTGGGTNATRLSNWLDPNNTGATFTNGTNIANLSPAVTGALSISGSNSFCTGTSQYTLNVNGSPFTGNVSWISLNTNIATVFPTGNPATVTKVGNGDVIIRATINACAITERTITVGTPAPSNITIWKSTSYATVGNPVDFVAGYPPSARCAIQNTDWQVSMSSNIWNGSFVCDPNDNNTSKLISFQSTGTAYVQARIQNGCGWSGWSYPVPIEVSGGYYFRVAPNPATSTITIEEDPAITDITKKGKSTFTAIDIYDKSGNAFKKLKYAQGTKRASIDVSLLPADTYVVKVFNGTNWEDHKVIVVK